MKKIIFLISYFGKMPEWINLYIESCKFNPTVDWMIFTDAEFPENKAKNVKFIKMSIDEFSKLASSKLGISLNIKNPYKLCDFKPFLGIIFRNYIKEYDFWGHTDLDIIYGDIRKFITGKILRHNFISTHQDLISGHFSLFRNCPEMNNKCLEIPKWKEKLSSPKYYALDEVYMFDLLTKERKYSSANKFIAKIKGKTGKLLKSASPFAYALAKKVAGEKSGKDAACQLQPKVFENRFYFTESYSTPVPGNALWRDGLYKFPKEWYWKKGAVTNSNGKGVEFLYLHFMHWKGGKWNKNGWSYSKKEGELVNFDYKKAKYGFRINKNGFFKLDSAKMGKKLLVTLADRNYVEQAKQLFSSVYWNSGWKGDYMLLAHEIPEKELKWFRKKGILVKKCKVIKSKKLVKSIFPPIVMSKFYLFTPEFKKWKNIVYLDSDIIVRGSLDRLANAKGFSAVRDITLRIQFESPYFIPQKNGKRKIAKALLSEIKSHYDLRRKSFNAGVIAFNTDIINQNTFSELKTLASKYSKIAKYEEQTLLNLFFYGKWSAIPTVYNIDYYAIFERYTIKPSEYRGAIIHFLGDHKPWKKKHPFFKEWNENLKKAELIELKKTNLPKEIWDNSRIMEYPKFMRKRRKTFAPTTIYIHQQLGLFGIFLKKNFPKVYSIVKEIKK